MTTMQLFKFKGGVKPDPQKSPSLQTPIGACTDAALCVSGLTPPLNLKSGSIRRLV